MITIQELILKINKKYISLKKEITSKTKEYKKLKQKLSNLYISDYVKVTSKVTSDPYKAILSTAQRTNTPVPKWTKKHILLGNDIDIIKRDLKNLHKECKKIKYTLSTILKNK